MSVVDGLPFPEEKKKYILEVLNPILEEMVQAVITEMPKSPLDFMILWLRRRCGAPVRGVLSDQTTKEALADELDRMAKFVQEAGTSVKTDEDGKEADSASESDDDDDEEEEPPQFVRPVNSKPRQSVSAEAYGAWNKKMAYTPPVHPKTEEQSQRLSQTLMRSFMFSSLHEEDLQTILMAMVEKRFSAAEKVIVEGDEGDFLFVIESGTFDCIKIIDGASKVVKTCGQGDVFGELALLYNCPRAASVVAMDDSVCWQLDRESFNHIVKDSAMKRRDKYENFLKSVTILSTISPYERSQICDALKVELYSEGDFIVKQDATGDNFYIVEEGDLYATKETTEGSTRVMEYSAGDYFGELALLKNQPRAASVIVGSGMAKVLSLDRQSFTKMLGPLQHILSKNVQNYK
eukprot:CAMPEP_0194519468 /NCGR_PEP_ID=MMETSP0253-20130528/53134_1 /TAXON_ID=2966 /ORGANISM="Noctiluca scintillans" /LENGTH=405 /DNA_ID=CAMNT_0039363613 /DNA_START=42 /DNA_END=1259 /DNA_ORIENTATION=+